MIVFISFAQRMIKLIIVFRSAVAIYIMKEQAQL